jgi:ubiquinone/menaquinone biosynthesis C-methylase UbiE
MIDFAQVANHYATYRPRYPAELIQRLEVLGFQRFCHRVLDVGTGAGNLASTLGDCAESIVAIDKSSSLAAHARSTLAQCRAPAFTLVAMAEHLPFRTGSFEWTFAAQSWHLFDRHVALREISRVLVPGGSLAIVYLSRLELKRNIVEVTHELIRRYNPTWEHGGTDGLYPEYIREIHEFGFEHIATFSLDIDIEYSLEAWIGRIVASKGVGASLGQAETLAFSNDLQRKLKEEGFPFPRTVPHRLFAIVARNGSVAIND